MLNAADVSKNKVKTADQLEGTFHEAGGSFPAVGVRNSLLEKEEKMKQGRYNAGSRSGCRNHLHLILHLHLGNCKCLGVPGYRVCRKSWSYL